MGPRGSLLPAARYLSGPKRTHMLDLFGVDTLPLPWTAEASPADDRRRNPNATVEEGKS